MFQFSGAIKMDECVREVISMVSRYAGGASVRGKFARIKEIMSVVTAEQTAGVVLNAKDFSFLTAAEIAAFSSLRISDHVDSRAEL